MMVKEVRKDGEGRKEGRKERRWWWVLCFFGQVRRGGWVGSRRGV
jgi:hypothetical protein